MQAQGFHVDGLRGLTDTFRELPKATKRNVLMRVLKEAIAPLAEAVTAKVPYLTGNLQQYQATGPTSKLTTRQKRMENRDKGAFEAMIHFGTVDPAGVMNEFGRAGQAAQPYFRSEWEGRKQPILREIGMKLGAQIEAAGVRLRRKNEKKG